MSLKKKIYKKEDPLTPIKNTRDLDAFCFSNYYRKRKSRLREKKCMSNWYTCVNGLPVIFGVSAMHRGFHGQTLRTALPPLHPRTVGILEAELLKSGFYLLSIKALLQWSFIVVIACDNQANCSNNAGNVCMDYVSCICAKFYTCINKTSVKCALYPGHWQIN